MSKSLKKFFLIFFLFYLFSLIQNSFLSHFSIGGGKPNLILIVALLLILFDAFKDNFGKIFGFLAGFSLDIFSPLPLGTATFSLGITILATKRILQNFKKLNFLLVLFSFILATLFFEFLTPFFSFLFKIPKNGITSLKVPLDFALMSALIYNIILGLLGYLLLRSKRP